MNDLENALRGAMLDTDATAPVRPDLAEWLLATTPRTLAPHAPGARPVRPAHRPAQRPRRGARWLLPVLAAAVIVALVVAGSLVLSTRSARRTPPVAPVTSLPTAALPTGFTATGFSFRDAMHGVAIGDGSCRGGASCPSLVRTSDGGASWHGVPLPAHVTSAHSCELGSAATGGRPCASDAVFGDDLHGYLWGGGRLFQTSDGGRAWTTPASVTGQVGAVVVAAGAAYLLVGSGSGSRSRVQLMTAAVGSTSWRPVGPSEAGSLDRSSLAASAGYVELGVVGVQPPAGRVVTVRPGGQVVTGADTSVCDPRAGGVVDSTAELNYLAVAPDGAVVLSCQDTTLSWIRVSSDHGQTFGPAREVPNTIHGSGGSVTSVAAGICPFSATRIDASGAPTVAGPGASYALTSDGGTHWTANGGTDVPEPPFGCQATGALTGFRIDPRNLGIQSTTDGSRTWHDRPIR